MSDDAEDAVREQASKYRREAQSIRERAAAATTPAVQRRLLKSPERLGTTCGCLRENPPSPAQMTKKMNALIGDAPTARRAQVRDLTFPLRTIKHYSAQPTG